jgi:hypothetical protein
MSSFEAAPHTSWPDLSKRLSLTKNVRLEGWRHVKVTERRTAVDYAHVLKELSDVHFPNAEKIVRVQDNLNTHTRPHQAEKPVPGILNVSGH